MPCPLLTLEQRWSWVYIDKHPQPLMEHWHARVVTLHSGLYLHQQWQIANNSRIAWYLLMTDVCLILSKRQVFIAVVKHFAIYIYWLVFSFL